nr:GNAT family N-acetyltransferase [Aliiroseovarius subalbicans]
MASTDDLDRLVTLVERAHALEGITQDDAARRDALYPLLEGTPYGAIWLIGPRSAPVGFIAASFGWSIARGGLEARIDAFFIREKVRGRGMGSEALASLARALSEQGITALHLEVAADNDAARRLGQRLGFAHRDQTVLMTRAV